MVCSATATVLLRGPLVTQMFSSLAASRSILSSPTPCLLMTFRRGAASMMARVICSFRASRASQSATSSKIVCSSVPRPIFMV